MLEQHPLIDRLNKQQQAAVTIEPAHTLILAGAGSGKTKVLTTRMAWLIQTAQVSPFNLLAVTFTNKAAREMLHRLSTLLPINTKGMWVGTFHGLCNRLLRTHFQAAGLPQSFQILDIADQLSAIKRLLKANNIDTEAYPARNVQKFINNAKEQGLRPNNAQGKDATSKNMADLYQKYQDQCNREGVVDFGELLLRAFELLSANASIREHYQRRFEHILVDEFQDTNILQYRWLKLLAGDATPIFAVGDDDQSIYAFRGANVANMSDFERNYAKGSVIRLEQNYRSQAHILNAANGLISNNNNRLGKNLWTDSGVGEPIKVVEQASDTLEASWVVDEIRSFLREGFDASQIAILYRSNAQSRPIEHALFSTGVSYRVYGGQRFFERQEIKHALAYLRLVNNPHDDTSFLRVVNFPTRGIGNRSLEQLTDLAQTYGISLASAVAYMSGKAATNLNKFLQLLKDMSAQAGSLDLPDLINQVVFQSGLSDFYENSKEGQERLENLQELVNAAAAFVGEEGFAGVIANHTIVNEPQAEPTFTDTLDAVSPLSAFLNHASLESGDNQARDGEDAVQLMTIHAAKGLEFDVVFITGLEEGLLPHENSMYEPGGLEEERRLMYVAITRARKHLILTLAQNRMLHGKTRYSARSSFLDEIPEEDLKWLTPKVNQSVEQAQQPWRGAFRRGMGGWESKAEFAPKAPRLSTGGVTVGEQKFYIGQTVSHKRFGDGTIIHLSGSGLDAQAQIQFTQAGTKTLALGVAKLETK